MPRRSLFGRSKESKLRKGQHLGTPPTNLHAAFESSNSEHQSEPSPLLIAKAVRDSELSSRSRSIDGSFHSVSSGTVFIPVNEDGQSTRSVRSRSSVLSRSPLTLGDTFIVKDQDLKLPSMSLARPGASAHAHALDGKFKETNNLRRGDVAHDFDIPELPRISRISPHPTREINSTNEGARPQDDASNIPPNMQPPGPGGPMHHLQPNMFMRRPPPVRMVVDELFRIDNGDFHAGERYLRLLRDALEMEGMASQSGEMGISCDPGETFLCIKQISERYHSRWSEVKQNRSRKKKDKASRLGQKIEVKIDVEISSEAEGQHVDQIATGTGLDDTKHSLSTMGGSVATGENKKGSGSSLIDIDEDTWNEIEQVCWEIFELAMWCCAILAKVCVGPAWNYQVKERRMRLQVARFERLRVSQSIYAAASNNSIPAAGTPAARDRQRMISFQEGERAELSAKSGAFFLSPPRQLQYPSIPEVLPISMLRFAAAFGNAILSKVKYPDSVVLLTKDKGCDDEEGEKIDLRNFANSLEQLLWEEQRSLIRRQRLGEAQRELSAALITDETEDDIDIVFDDQSATGRSVASQSKRYKWNIPGSHEPVATMIRSWLETTLVGWPHDAIRDLTPENSRIMDSRHVQVTWGTIANNGAVDW
jgi:hypothetical protein